MNEDLRTQVLAILGMLDEAPADQNAVLAQVDEIADSRLARIVPYLLTADQLHELCSRGTTDIRRWVVEHVPHYQDVVHAVVLDVADEARDINQMHALMPSG